MYLNFCTAASSCSMSLGFSPRRMECVRSTTCSQLEQHQWRSRTREKMGQCSVCPSVTALAWSGGSSREGPGMAPRGYRNSCGSDKSAPAPEGRVEQSRGIQPCMWPSIMKINYELSHHCITFTTLLSPNPSPSETPWHHLYSAQMLPQANRISLQGGTLLPAGGLTGMSPTCAGCAQGIWDGWVTCLLWVLATCASQHPQPCPYPGCSRLWPYLTGGL